MSSSIDSGYYAQKADEIRKSKCSQGGSHEWQACGSWPSIWGICKKCGRTYFNK